MDSGVVLCGNYIMQKITLIICQKPAAWKNIWKKHLNILTFWIMMWVSYGSTQPLPTIASPVTPLPANEVFVLQRYLLPATVQLANIYEPGTVLV